MALFDSLGAAFSTTPADQAAAAKTNAAMAGLNLQTSTLGAGADAMRDYYTRALTPYTSLWGGATGGYNAYADASGANGPEGLARAKAQFQASPGFEFQVGTGVDALTRAGIAAGGATGNTMTDALKYASGLAQQDWGNYVSRLAPWLGQANTVAGGIAGINEGLGSGIANIYGQQAQDVGQAFGTGGQAQADAALAPYNASKNLWGAIQSAANTAANIYTGGASGALTSALKNAGIGQPQQPGPPTPLYGGYPSPTPGPAPGYNPFNWA